MFGCLLCVIVYVRRYASDCDVGIYVSQPGLDFIINELSSVLILITVDEMLYAN